MQHVFKWKESHKIANSPKFTLRMFLVEKCILSHNCDSHECCKILVLRVAGFKNKKFAGWQPCVFVLFAFSTECKAFFTKLRNLICTWCSVKVNDSWNEKLGQPWSASESCLLNFQIWGWFLFSFLFLTPFLLFALFPSLSSPFSPFFFSSFLILPLGHKFSYMSQVHTSKVLTERQSIAIYIIITGYNLHFLVIWMKIWNEFGVVLLLSHLTLESFYPFVFSFGESSNPWQSKLP